ncbi:aldehyde dehydrogenase [Fictibacillus macauensis ZFHKF-1]|uniref:Aldehyde dehydrogenase n=1 Tax=Fictibacillus macauensis ZFHKF-1 TaxID=1196324 RepID=I8UCX2_9BACL|nr:aldehyde dehydrogenase family protein [Fictibacillus macauensis]EIT84770.1 aldehyde dehydrogenase [Fictibacillus macauensis ZFHKF-1]
MGTLMAINPATGKVIDEVEETSLEMVPEMMAQAREAFEGWKTLPIRERLHYFKRLRLLLVQELDHCVEIIASDAGKPKVEAITAELLTTVESLRHLEKHGEDVLRTKKVKTPLALLGKKSYIVHEPKGTVLIISPWNYPFSLAVIPMLSALVSGNCVILKPSEITPMIGKLIQSLFAKAGFPDGTVQVAHGSGELGARLVAASPNYILFTGSIKTGKKIQKAAAEQLIGTTLELSGKDPMIVFDDAHLERAAKGAVWGALTNSGQVCMSVERIYVQQSVYAPFIELLKKELNTLRQEISDDTDLGVMTFAPQVAIVKEHLRDAMEKGAIQEVGSYDESWHENDSFRLEPVLLTNVTEDMKIMSEETFGPVLCVVPFSSEDEAVRCANDSEFGLNASVFSKDIEKAKRVAARLETGAVCINDVVVSFANPHLPFGGVKNSGLGRYHGRAGIELFTEPKAILLDEGKKATEVNWYPYAGKYPYFKQLITAYYGKRIQWPSFLAAYRKLLKKSQ